MTSENDKDRFELLDAGRALGDLSPEEEKEWKALSTALGTEGDAEFDWIVSALETEFAQRQQRALSPELTDRLHKDAEEFTPSEEPPSRLRKVLPVLSFATAGWLAAACFAVLFIVNLGMKQGDDGNVSAGAVRNALVEQADSPEVTFSAFSGTAAFDSLSGDVVWSDSEQTGFMRLSGLAANDPTQAQYQLWIVDPTRASEPVDGGVFDIVAGSGESIVPIDAKLPIQHPKAFVITREKPGGVVVSKQEIVVAIAQAG
ncbi:MAG: anti-sigma factor [Verrucomicrobiota bacterium]